MMNAIVHQNMISFPGSLETKAQVQGWASERTTLAIFDILVLRGEPRLMNMPEGIDWDFIVALTELRKLAAIVRWFLALGRLQEYRLAVQIARQQAIY